METFHLCHGQEKACVSEVILSACILCTSSNADVEEGAVKFFTFVQSVLSDLCTNRFVDCRYT